MSTKMTASPEVDAYCAAVRDALHDLPDDAREELLDDLADHLNEVFAESEGSLLERLGEPVAYADELRVAAGLEPAIEDARSVGMHARLDDAVHRGAALAARADLRLGRV